MGTLVAVLDKKSQRAAEIAVSMLKTSNMMNSQAYGIASSTGIKIGKTIEATAGKVLTSQAAIGYVFNGTSGQDKPQPWKLENAAIVFDGRLYLAESSELKEQDIVEKLRPDCEETKALFTNIDGDFAVVMAKSDGLIAGRDPLGVRPLYFGEDECCIAFASERKALWKIGLETKAFPPGHLGTAYKHGIEFKTMRTLAPSRPENTTLQAASVELQTLLERSVKRRVSRVKEVAVAFSGGLDSTIIALLAKSSNANVHLIHVSLANQTEIQHARKAAEELKLPIHIHTYTEQNVKDVLPKVLMLVEEPDPLMASVGIPVFWTAEKAAEMDLHVMVAGQGADELFGGYKRYVDSYLRYGSEKTQSMLFRDVLNMHKTNFERDSKICNFHGIDLRLPFVTCEIAEFALAMPLNLKMEPSSHSSRKLVLRQVAKNIGLPQMVVERPKKAIQYATGVNRVLRKIAKQEKMSLTDYLKRIFRHVLDDDYPWAEQP
jgi:asparagine synthase (glutamine-hydrolysing)